ncbi:response regulator [Roseomonas haemaphysalidis]|uniref:Response regulator n=1 Tax=Roseomonas haemaphysalidis TaxID=2768162 RepID=A0ABS3KK71_9PROT|nr:response regulator [Roseomonas haemaphysalidis]MBO1077850.1 response regulator [Roseomonas haemaphysalidis]
MPSTAHILVVDDDPDIRELIAGFLERHGFSADSAADAVAMEQALERRAADLIVLDLMMPGEDGLSLLRRITAGPRTPVIILSAVGDDTDRIVGLELGADDYLSKPCNPRELLARVRAVLRRRSEATAAPGEGVRSVAEFERWTLDRLRRELHSPGGVLVDLSDGEFSLLVAFLERPGRVLTRDQLLDYARGPESEAFDRAVDVQISRLRRKLALGAGGNFIRTVRNEGYLFEPEVTWK